MDKLADESIWWGMMDLDWDWKDSDLFGKILVEYLMECFAVALKLMEKKNYYCFVLFQAGKMVSQLILKEIESL